MNQERIDQAARVARANGFDGSDAVQDRSLPAQIAVQKNAAPFWNQENDASRSRPETSAAYGF